MSYISKRWILFRMRLSDMLRDYGLEGKLLVVGGMLFYLMVVIEVLRASI